MSKKHHKSFERSLFEKFYYTITSLKNWYLIPFDKFGIHTRVIYKLKGSLVFSARSKSTDINEMIAIMSGLIYPSKFCTVKNGDTIVDLGASCGEFVLFTKSINPTVRFKGFAIEPYHPNILALKENIRINSIKNYTVIPTAVSDNNKDVFLNTSTTFDNIQVSSFKTSTLVKANTLYTLAKKHHIKKIALLKVDIEGHEYEVLKQSYKFILSTTQKILIEYHNINSQKNYKALIKLFRDDFTINHFLKDSPGGILCLENKSLK